MPKMTDISGMRFGKLVAIRPTDKRSGSSVVWECKCDCGNTCYVAAYNLRSGRTKSCGCCGSCYVPAHNLRSRKTESCGCNEKDISGMRFGKLVAIKPTDKRNRSHVVWECKCDCGNTCYVEAYSLRSGRTKSCGCSKVLNLSGKRFGMLTAIKPTDNRQGRKIIWECKCDCGNTCYVSASSLSKGAVQSCGCQTVDDVTGKRFGMLTAIKPTNKRDHECIVWECRCDCGNIRYTTAKMLKSGSVKSCGCLSKRKPEYLNAKDITGKRIGMLTAIRSLDSVNKSGYRFWECKCDCGNTCYVPISKLDTGSTKSCGCEELVDKPTGELGLEGMRFGRLVALKPTGRRAGRCVVWECKCDCGNTCYVRSTSLKAGITKSCGCLAKEMLRESRKIDISGKRFGTLVAVKPLEERRNNSIVWECKCDCGNTCYAPVSWLQSGNKVSCGRGCTSAARNRKVNT